MSVDIPIGTTSVSLAQLDERSREIFRRIVETYLATGDPVGSRNVSRVLQTALSPASVRNVMADLESLGLVYAPHTSAGQTADRIRAALLCRRVARVRRSAGRRAPSHRCPGARGARGQPGQCPERSIGDAVGTVARRRSRHRDKDQSAAEARRVRGPGAGPRASRARVGRWPGGKPTFDAYRSVSPAPHLWKQPISSTHAFAARR